MAWDPRGFGTRRLHALCAFVLYHMGIASAIPNKSYYFFQTLLVASAEPAVITAIVDSHRLGVISESVYHHG